VSPALPIDDIDRKILDAIQRDFPVCARPYAALGRKLDLPESEVHRRVSALRTRGVIRRLGPLFDSRKLGFRGLLAAAKVRPDAVERVTRVLWDCDEVTHNYLRTGEFNVWFTVTVPGGDDPERVLERVRACEGVSTVRVFPSTRVFKLNAAFQLGSESHG
jgi:DNA-binding Lrp family transcriptional regulator